MPALPARHRSEAADESGVLKRRGLLAAAAAFVAGALAKLSEQPLYAGADGDVVLGTINNAATTSVINCTATDGHAFQAIGSGAGFGVWGTSPNGYPIFGQVAGGSSANCMESPECWFEDFGIGSLECGRAEITIDPDFAAMAALMGKREGELSGDFSWRIVAKRRDIPGPRLETVSIPSEPALPSIPDLTGRGFAQ